MIQHLANCCWFVIEDLNLAVKSMNEHHKECPRDRMLTENAHQAHLLRTRQHQGLFSRARTYGEHPSIAGKYSLFSYDHIINIETFSRRWFIYLLLFAICCSPSCLCQGLVSLILSVFYNWSPSTCLLYYRLAYFVLSVYDCFFFCVLYSSVADLSRHPHQDGDNVTHGVLP